MKRVSIWGSTGSIGTQTLDVIRSHRDRFAVHLLTAHSNAELAFRQALEFRPEKVVITGNPEKDRWAREFKRERIPLFWGREALLSSAREGAEDLAVNALTGSAGLEATLLAIDAGVSLALANKEALVMAGGLVMEKVRERGVSLIPVDSEHSALFQCLAGEKKDEIRRLLLTASGGPFLSTPVEKLSHVTVREALSHPNWSMGKKVTIDSATMMNKGLEVIEARWLFGVEPSRITVLIHPRSIVHSMVEFIDGSVKAQMGMPDMRIPISYALSYPERMHGEYRRMDFTKEERLEFFPPDPARFPALRLAYAALEAGGTAPAVLNAADEEAVNLFLEGRISFTHIMELVEKALERHASRPSAGLSDILEADRLARETVCQLD